ncbi:myb-like protein X [Vespula squamosa]|uniref:Myb-like protein X n=1 Tax=Vespula squamosa TaxID=30214 RepID=A0ABD2A5N4_VESSQ
MIIKNDSEKENLLIDAEEEKEVEDEGKDYDSIDNRFYSNNDDSRDKFNFNQKDVGVWLIIDLANLNLNSKIPNTMYRKNEIKWMIETNNNNMEITENNIEIRIDYDSERFNHGLKNEFRRN